MLLERYQRQGSWVDGLFLWLTAVVSCTHLTFVYQNIPWTTRATDVLNFMDSVIVFAEGCYLVTKSQLPLLPKEAKDEYTDALQVHGAFTIELPMMSKPVHDLQSRCADMDISPEGQPRCTQDLMAELFSLSTIHYRATLVSWLQRNKVHLDFVFDWCKQQKTTVNESIALLSHNGDGGGLEILLCAMALDININVIQADSVWSAKLEGVDFWDPTVVWTASGAVVCQFSSQDGIEADLDTSESPAVTSSIDETPASLLESPLGGRPLSQKAEYPEVSSLSTETNPDDEFDVDACEVHMRQRPSGKASPQNCRFEIKECTSWSYEVISS